MDICENCLQKVKNAINNPWDKSGFIEVALGDLIRIGVIHCHCDPDGKKGKLIKGRMYRIPRKEK